MSGNSADAAVLCPVVDEEVKLDNSRIRHGE